MACDDGAKKCLQQAGRDITDITIEYGALTPGSQRCSVCGTNTRQSYSLHDGDPLCDLCQDYLGKYSPLYLISEGKRMTEEEVDWVLGLVEADARRNYEWLWSKVGAYPYLSEGQARRLANLNRPLVDAGLARNRSPLPKDVFSKLAAKAAENEFLLGQMLTRTDLIPESYKMAINMGGLLAAKAMSGAPRSVLVELGVLPLKNPENVGGPMLIGLCGNPSLSPEDVAMLWRNPMARSHLVMGHNPHVTDAMIRDAIAAASDSDGLAATIVWERKLPLDVQEGLVGYPDRKVQERLGEKTDSIHVARLLLRRDGNNCWPNLLHSILSNAQLFRDSQPDECRQLLDEIEVVATKIQPLAALSRRKSEVIEEVLDGITQWRNRLAVRNE